MVGGSGTRLQRYQLAPTKTSTYEDSTSKPETPTKHEEFLPLLRPDGRLWVPTMCSLVQRYAALGLVSSNR
jgi:hypothetical protein